MLLLGCTTLKLATGAFGNTDHLFPKAAHLTKYLQEKWLATPVLGWDILIANVHSSLLRKHAMLLNYLCHFKSIISYYDVAGMIPESIQSCASP